MMLFYTEEARLFEIYKIMNPVLKKWEIRKDTPPDIKKRLEEYIANYVYPGLDKDGFQIVY